jgi:hypothetical protein
LFLFVMHQYIGAGAANHLDQCSGAADKKYIRNLNNLKNNTSNSPWQFERNLDKGGSCCRMKISQERF